MLVDDPAVKAQIAPIYQECLGMLWQTIYKDRVEAAARIPTIPSARMLRVRAPPAPRRSLRGVPAAPHQLRAVRPDRRIDLQLHVVGDAPRASRRHRRIAHHSREHDQGDDIAKILGVPKEDGWLIVDRVLRLPDRQVGRRPRRPVHRSATAISGENRWAF
jgi:hypothetical protein